LGCLWGVLGEYLKTPLETPYWVVQVANTQINTQTPVMGEKPSPVTGQAQQPLTWVRDNKVVVRSSGMDRSVRYYVVTGLETYDDVILGEKYRVIRATGIWQDEKLDYETNEGAVVIVETDWGFEHCGVVRHGVQSRIYINHMGIDIQNVDLIMCPKQSEVIPIIQELREHGLSIISSIINPWVDIVPYVLYTLRKFGYRINLSE